MERFFYTIFAVMCILSNASAEGTFVVSDIAYKTIGDSSVVVSTKDDNYSALALRDSTLNIPSTVSYNGKKYQVKAVSEGAFAYCCGIRNVDIGEGVEEISDAAFAGCANLRKITIPASMRKLGKYIFAYCLNLSAITVDRNNGEFDSREDCNAIITKRGNRLVYGCNGTKIPKSVEIINDYAFHGCTIESVAIPEGVAWIRPYAFFDCHFLRSVRLSSTVSCVDEWSFCNCPNIFSITVDPNNEAYDSRNDCNAVIDKGTGKLVLGCSSTIVPYGVTSIGRGAFAYADKLRSIAIPEGVTTIDGEAFAMCSALKNVSLPSTLVRFEGHTNFWMCTSLERIIIPSGVRELPNDIFTGCTSLQSITVASGNVTYDSRNNCNAIIRTDNNELVAGCTGTTIVDGIENIGENAFRQSGLTSLHIPVSVVKIDSSAFVMCRQCQSITVAQANKFYKSSGDNTVVERATGKLVLACSSSFLGKEVRSIGAHAFLNTPSVLVLPSGILEIGDCAFVSCEQLSKIYIPSTVRHIGRLAFAGCSHLKRVLIMGNKVKIEEDAFK